MIWLLFLLQAEQTFAKRCASCHFVPDQTIERDRVWTELIKTTTWADGADDRESLIQFLKTQKPAKKIDAPSEKGITAKFAKGSVMLVPEKGEPLRVVFNGDGPRAVPTGKYRVSHYDIVQDGFILSASGHDGPTLDLKNGSDRRGDRLQTAPSDGRGLSVVIIKGVKLIDYFAIVRDVGGKELRRTTMKYG